MIHRGAEGNWFVTCVRAAGVKQRSMIQTIFMVICWIALTEISTGTTKRYNDSKLDDDGVVGMSNLVVIPMRGGL